MQQSTGPRRVTLAVARFCQVRTITTERLRLRPWREDDAEFLLDFESRWEVVRFLGTHHTALNTHDEALASIARRRAIDHPIHGVWLITTAADGGRVGNLLLKPIPLSRGVPSDGAPDVEIGWRLHPDAWRRGYATEAAAAVLDDAFDRGLAQVLAVTHPDNQASQAVCRRLGMTHLGRTTRYYDASNELFVRRAG